MMTKLELNKRRALIVRCQAARNPDAPPKAPQRGRRRDVEAYDPDESSRGDVDERMLVDLPDSLFD